ncbi:MAG: hypothetical protein Q4P24_17645, partial [Rhodobacterales bacterium]|nr:hypothetical protein [Rhodobacterales bacterium]
MKTLEQQIATAEAKLSRLKTKKKASDTRVKILVGAVVAKAALESPEAAANLASLLRANWANLLPALGAPVTR